MYHQPRPYRLLKVEQVNAGTCLYMSENGMGDPDAEIVLIWQDEKNVMWIHWNDEDHRLDPLSWRASLEVGKCEAYVIISNGNPIWRRNAAT